MTNLAFDDAVTAGNLPGQKYSVYYEDGRYANYAAVRAKEGPNAKLYGITVRGATGHDIAICDCETGDLTIPETEAWVATQVHLGVALIIVYANEDTWERLGLKAALAKYGDRIKRWIAHYGVSPVVPAGYDALQFADPGPVDHNVALPSFFTPWHAPAPTDPNHYDWFQTGPFPYKGQKLNERAIVKQYDAYRRQQTLLKHPHRAELKVLREQLAFLAARVAYLAHKRDPSVTVAHALAIAPYHGGWRYQQLIRRAQGKRVAK